MNIVIPMAGAGSRFVKAGFSTPKPLIPVHSVPMIRLVIENIKPDIQHKFIFICQNEHISRYALDSLLQTWAPESIIIGLDGVTEGAACTVLCAREYINSDESLIIANSDQFIEYNINKYIVYTLSNAIDGCIMTMKANDPKWSFVDFNHH